MNKRKELIEMLREYISAAKNPTSSVHLVVLSLPEATDLLRELEGEKVVAVAKEIDRLLTGGIDIHTNSPIHERLKKALTDLPQPPKTER